MTPRPKNRRSLAAAPHMVWAILFIVAPLIFVAVYAFRGADGSFSLENFRALGDYTDAFVRSASYSLIATVICLVIGYPLAYAISLASPKAQRVLIMMAMLPMWINFLIRTYAIMKLLEDTGFVNSLIQKVFGEEATLHMINTPGAVIFGMVYDYLPYMVLPIYTVLSKIDPKLGEAASDLGCSKIQTLFRVTLPLSVSGVVSGITMVFVPSISTFYISQKLGGGQYLLIGDAIERAFGNPEKYSVGAAMSFVLMLIVLISTAIMNRYDRDNAKGGVMV